MSKCRFEWSVSWLSIKTGGSVLGSLFLLIYKNDLPQGLNSEVKLFTDDTSKLTIANCVNFSASALNNDLLKMQDWAYQWKMSVNPDRNKHAQEFIFSRKKPQPHVHHSFSTDLKLSSFQIRSIWDFLWIAHKR